MSTLGQVLATVAGLTGEPDPTSLETLLETGRRSNITTTIVEEAEGITDAYQKRQVIWALTAAASQLERNSDAVTDARTITEILPEIEEVLANWTDPDTAPRTDLPEYSDPIHLLQEILGAEHDGAFGTETAQALLNYETNGISDGFAGGHSFDTRQFPALDEFLENNAGPYYAQRDQALEASQRIASLQTALGAQSQAFNDLITTEFERCTGEVIDLGDANPFIDILQEIAPFAQTVDEQAIAHERVAEAVTSACGRYLDQLTDDTVKEEIVASLAARLEGPLNDAVSNAIDTANEAIQVERFRQGFETHRVIEGFLNHRP